MERERWQAIDALFEAVLDQGAGQREALLEAARPELRREVVRLLAADSSSANFLAEDAATLLRVREALPKIPAAPDRLGAYRVLGRLGGGGMGEVLLGARADDSFERKVAIKRIRADLPASRRGELLARFQVERRILAQLEHPQIARLYDGDLDTDGNPFLVLEYVEGAPLDRFCDDAGLDLTSRLRLFAGVCRVVSFAHRHLVVHRDLKPANILVRADGSPVLLDFGIAKWLDPEAGGGPSPTESGARPMTPSYASPEQVKGQPINTASDVYSLGVVLYELLTGRLPYRGRLDWRHQLEQAICEQEPPRPSTAVSEAPDDDPEEGRPAAAETVAARRGTSLRRLALQLRGDLDTLLAKALRKDPAERYASVDALADDIDRYLEGRPLAAQPPSRRQALIKFARRHRLGVGLAALALITLLSGAAALALQARQLSAERDKARLALSFLIDVFGAADPGHPAVAVAGAEPLARDVLDQAAARVQAELAGQGAVQATLMDAMGQVYSSLGAYPQARDLYEQALARRRAEVEAGEPARLVLEPLWHLAGTLAAENSYDRAEVLLAEAEALADRDGAESPAMAATLFHQAELAAHRTRHAEAVGLYRRSLALRRQQLPPDHPDLLLTLEGLCGSLAFVGEASRSLPLHREMLATRRRTLGNDHPDVARTLAHIGTIETLIDRNQAAGEALTEALAIRRRVFGPRHRLLAESLLAYSNWQRGEGRIAEAVASAREATAMYEQLGVDPVDQSLGWTALGHGLIYQDAFPEAVALYRRALAVRQAALPADHNLITNGHLSLGVGLRLDGAIDEAEHHLVLAFDRLIAANPASSRADLALEHLAEIYRARNQRDALARVELMTKSGSPRSPLGPGTAPATRPAGK